MAMDIGGGLAEHRVIVIGGGVGGLACAIDLARSGMAVTLFERAPRVGGKIRQNEVAGRGIDAGPTVFTLRDVFESLFSDAGAQLRDYLTLHPLSVLARHAWPEGPSVDLFADPDRTAAAIEDFAGGDEAAGLITFLAEARRIFECLRPTFLEAPLTGPFGLAQRFGLGRWRDLAAIRPFETLWHALGRHFRDPRLLQLFGRYATYCGASPFSAPATLMLIAHVEQAGVWRIEGGMIRLAEALHSLALRLGVDIQTEVEVDTILTASGAVSGVRFRPRDGDNEIARADAVVFNGDPAALAEGLLGAEAVSAGGRQGPRSLSALTWTFAVRAPAAPLLHHTVLFSADYAAEFRALTRRNALWCDPTLYISAQDRADAPLVSGETERLMVLANAPALGPRDNLSYQEIAACRDAAFHRLRQMGVRPELAEATPILTTPRDFDAAFPATRGALYGRAVRGWSGAFRRPGSRSPIPGLYLAGGGVHPGAGLPMAAISGRLAASALIFDLASRRRWRRGAMLGGTSTPKAMTGRRALS